MFCARGILVLYISSSFWLLGVESCDFSHAEKERTACKAEKIHKMTIIFTQNNPNVCFKKTVTHLLVETLANVSSLVRLSF